MPIGNFNRNRELGNPYDFLLMTRRHLYTIPVCDGQTDGRSNTGVELSYL